jgi:hypothetical protein
MAAWAHGLFGCHTITMSGHNPLHRGLAAIPVRRGRPGTAASFDRPHPRAISEGLSRNTPSVVVNFGHKLGLGTESESAAYEPRAVRGLGRLPCAATRGCTASFGNAAYKKQAA